MTRRRFLGYAAGAVSLPWPFALRPFRTSRFPVVLDLQQHCSLAESVAGYKAALASFGSGPQCRALIVPGAVELPSWAVGTILSSLQSGGTVILESGAGFASEADWRAHRAVLRDALQLEIETPVRLWPRNVPYVDYSWPYPAKLRDFSHVVPAVRQGGEIIALVDDLPVALKRPVALGTLIFLGSPLGPALWAGDVEARRWLRAALTPTFLS